MQNRTLVPTSPVACWATYPPPHSDRGLPAASPDPRRFLAGPAGRTPADPPPFRTGNTFVFWFGKDGRWSCRGTGAATGGATRTFGFKAARGARCPKTQSRTQKEHKRKALVARFTAILHPSLAQRFSRPA